MHLREGEPNVVEGLDLSTFNPLNQGRFVELMLRDAEIELDYGGEKTITGRIEWRNDSRCFCIVARDGDWVGLPPEDLDDAETVLDLYVQRGVSGMRFRVIGELGPRRYPPGKGLDDQLNSTVSAEEIQRDIEAHRRQAAMLMAIKDDNRRRDRNNYRGN